VPFDDLFTPTVGTTYHYRVTTLDMNGDESYPSNEITYTVTGQHITDVSPQSAFYGDQVTITGDTFGVHNPATDSVLFEGALGGTVSATIEDWQPTQIVVDVPSGAKTGVVTVAINGYEVQSTQTVSILNPVITGFNPASVFVGQPLTIVGVGFGATQGGSTLTLGVQDLTSQVSAWTDKAIALSIPVGVAAGDFTVHAGHDSNAAPFSPRAEILTATPAAAISGETVTLIGRYFGATQGQVNASGGGTVAITSWSDTAISLSLTAAPGAYTLTPAPAGAPLPGNDFAFPIEPALAVQLGGVADGSTLTPDTPPALTVTVPPDTEQVELLLNGVVVFTSTTAPYTDLSLPLSATHNGAYALTARAQRRSETADSAPLTVSVVSLPGDINGDGVVDNVDRDALVLELGLKAGDAQYHPWYDTDGDGVVTEADLSRIGYNFGKTL
jgi:hypothetical protein